MRGTSLSAGLVAAGNAIGDMEYSSTRYIRPDANLTEAVSSLDASIGRLSDQTRKYHREMKSGFAGLAALSGLVPNARASGDTQLSVGTGYYRGTMGVALGAFQHINDNILLNIGGAYGGNGSTTFKGGATIGF